jgi:bifunctional UDP-N-acetylglucosamine pyrophosphorylase/glucosamine-1-phosphate N-acetyltransferase
LAAGKGTRLNSAQPKPAVRVGGLPMASRVLQAMRGAGISRIIAVVGHRAADVQEAVGNGVEYVTQGQQLGTGHATRQSEVLLRGYDGPVVVAYSDLPLLRERDIARLLRWHLETGAEATLLTAVFPKPGTLGRILRGDQGQVLGIVEFRDATEEQREIKEINVGVYCFTAPLLFEVLGQVTNDNAQQQYYLTDAIAMLARMGKRVEAVAVEQAHAGMGVDTADDLSRAQVLWDGQ